MSVQHKSKNGGLKGLFGKLEKMSKYSVFVGIPKSDNKDVDNINLATIAAINELGTADIPSRPFLRQTLSDNSKKYANMYRNSIINNEEPIKLLKIVAKVAQSDVQESFVKGEWVDNSQATIAKKSRTNVKGGSGVVRPLIDTGRLRQSIKGVVMESTHD